MVELEDVLPAHWLDQPQQKQMHPDPDLVLAALDPAVMISCRVKLLGLQTGSLNGTLGTISSCDAVAGKVRGGLGLAERRVSSSRTLTLSCIVSHHITYKTTLRVIRRLGGEE